VGRLVTDLRSNILRFLAEQRIKMKLRIISDSEFWLEGPYSFLTVGFRVDNYNHRVSYDLFSPEYDVHLREKNLGDVESLDMLVEEKGKWNYEKSIEDSWLILDCVKLWAQENRFTIREEGLI
jgi:hypothetical protein